MNQLDTMAKKHGSTSIKKKTQRGPSKPCNKQKGSPAESSSSSKVPINKPRNLILLDATGPLTFQFQRYGTPVTLTFEQTPAEETWPGGATWDLGWFLARLLCNGSPTITTSSGLSLHRQGYQHSVSRRKIRTILELGCGVGLTGLVAAAALGPSLTVLTDLAVVVENVTHPNVHRNTIPTHHKHYRVLPKSGGARVAAVPLCWGNTADEAAVQELLGTARTESSPFPDLILVGDVAYQHKPGAPSHFDALASTLSRMAGPQTLLVLGLRIRMPASIDLWHLLQQEFCEERPAVSVEELEPSLSHVKHNMSIHFLIKKATKDGGTATNLGQP